jgi:hypothetical protein
VWCTRRQLGLDRIVALKVILHAEHSSGEMRSRFHHEAQAIARLQTATGALLGTPRT